MPEQLAASVPSAPPLPTDAGTMLLIGASLVLIAGGIVAAALWFVWRLAEIVP